MYFYAGPPMHFYSGVDTPLLWGATLWVSGLPPSDSGRSLRQATYPQLLYHDRGHDPLMVQLGSRRGSWPLSMIKLRGVLSWQRPDNRLTEGPINRQRTKIPDVRQGQIALLGQRLLPVA